MGEETVEERSLDTCGPVDQPDAPLVCVLTLNWNGRRWLGECLSSILALDYDGFETVVVDNGSTDGSAAFVRERFPSVHVIENGRNLGYPAGFNVGMDYAYARGADYFLIMNNDTVIEPRALREMVAVARSSHRIGIVTGKVYFYDRPSVLQTVGKSEHPIHWTGDDIGESEEDRGQYDVVAERPFVDDIYLLVSRAMYEDVGGYDAGLFLQCEGFDWQVRARKKSWRFYFTPEAKVWHHSGRSTGGRGSPISEFFFHRNRLEVMAKHGGWRRYVRLWAHVGLDRMWSVLKALVGSALMRRKSRESLVQRLAGWLGWCTGTLWLLHRRPATGVPPLIRRLNGSFRRPQV